MSNINPQNNLDSKDPVPLLPPSSDINPKTQNQDQEEEESKDQSILLKEGFCPPKQDSSALISDNQIKNGEPSKKSGENHSEKFNGPLEKPKTANKAFGSISDFLLFFENRHREIKNLANKFREMENADSMASLIILNEEVVPLVYKSFKNMPVEFKNYESFKPVEKTEENASMQKAKILLSKFIKKKKIQKEEKTDSEYAELFKKKFPSMEEFYKQILHAYTIPGFLYLRMNEYLRTENWMELDHLLIYTYCIFKAYLWGPTGLTEADSFAFLKSKSDNGKLTLYRRADFDQGCLDFYDLNQIKEFSWSGVTSTSLLESATRPFSGKRPDKKPVLIVIEVDFKDLQPENFNALYLAKISKCPGEEEVALAPGSIFELSDINKEKPEVEMRLRLITDAKILAQKGKFLHGMLQEVMRSEDELKLVCLKEKELSRAIKHCKGNQLVKKLEFSLCHLNKWSAKVLLDVLPTIKSLNSFILNSVILEAGCLDQILQCLGGLKIKQLEISNSLDEENDIKSFVCCIKYFGSLEILRLSFEENFKVDANIMRELYNEAIQYLDSKCIFELNMMNDCDIFVKGLNISNYKQSFRSRLDQKWLMKSKTKSSKDRITSFSKLRIKEEPTKIIDDEQKEIKLSKDRFEKKSEEKEDLVDETSTKQVAKSLDQENSLNLIGKKEVLGYRLGDNSCLPKRTLLEALEDKYAFTQGLKDLTLSGKQSLETLNLYFERCKNLHDRDLKSLGCEGIQFLHSLTTLNLNFNYCNGITNKALDILSNNVIRKLTGLNNLHLSFERCTKVTDEGLKILACDGIQHLQSLTGLNLNFNGCKALTNTGLESLILEGIAKIKSSLTSIHLNFEGCENITDEGLENLFHNDGFESLTSLDLNFNYCSKITDKGIEVIAQKGLQKFKKCLKVLSLSFNPQKLDNQSLTYEDLSPRPLPKCSEITDEGLITLSEGLGHLELLTSLSLKFSGEYGSKITDKGIMSVYNQGIRHLGSLTVLRLRFDGCKQITNEGLQSLHFPNDLMILNLNFNYCNKITDDGIDDLPKKISHLKSLEHLHLSFRDCGKITDHRLGLLCSEGIKSLQKLSVLHLQFGNALESQTPRSKITDQSLKSIGSEGIKNLPELKTLHLDLIGCSEITDKGLENLCNDGIQYLKKLTDLHLGFSRCEAITDEGLEILSSQGIFPLKPSLKILSLDFYGCPKLSNVGLESLLNEGIHYLDQLTTLNLEFLYSDKIEINQLLLLQYQINLLNLPQLQLPLEASWIFYDWNSGMVSSPSYQFSSGPHTASVLCQDSLGFTPKASTNLLCDNESQKVENLTLKFEQGPDITDSDIFNSLFRSNPIKTFRDLKTLHLTFDECVMITDFALHNLCSKILQHLESLNFLHLSMNGCDRITDAGLASLGSVGIQPLKLLTDLSLSFNRCQRITNQGLSKLFDLGLLHLQSLKSMYLSFQFCERITKGLERLYFNDMKSLTSFFIDLPDIEITEKLKGQFSQSSSSSFIFINKNSSNKKLIGTSQFQRQKIDTSFSLSKIQPVQEDSVEIVHNKMFRSYRGRNCYVFKTNPLNYFCRTIYNNPKKNNIMENLDNIFISAKRDFIALTLLSSMKKFEKKAKKFINEQDSQEIQYLESLASFNLVLGEWAKKITDSALLCLSIFQRFKSLTNLYLNFDGCKKITNIGWKNLGSQGIRYLASLTTLHLSFKKGVQITDIELKTLSSEGIQSLKALTTLHLDFEKCQGITDLGLKNLWTDGVLHLKSLTTLDLRFRDCSQITGVSFNTLNCKETECLKFLTSLHLNFDCCVNFKDEGVESLCVGVIQHLTVLTTLHLNFDGNGQITDSGLEYLSSQGLGHLKFLTSLHLSLDNCQHITDKGVQSLNLSSFKLFTSLYLNFDQCPNLTDQSLKNLAFYLRSLKTLHLSLRGCSSAVTDQVLKDLGIQYLTSLDALYLCFDGCKEITDQGIEALCSNGIQSLEFLKTLHLSFGLCEKITEKGLESLQNGIKHLSLLENLHLCFLDCQEISHAQLSLLQVQNNLPQLQSPLRIIDKVIFSESYLRDQRFLGDTYLSEKFFFKRPELHPGMFNKNPDGTLAKNNYYSVFKTNTNGRVAILQKLQNKRLGDGKFLRFEDSFHVNDLGVFQKCYNCSDQMESFNNLEVLKITVTNHHAVGNFKINMRSLCRGILPRLKSLKILHISFEWFDEITDEELGTLAFEGISSLVELTHLHLSLNGCEEITDQGLVSLSSGGIQNLKQLNLLHLNFSDCDKITDKGLANLCSDGIQYLKGLKTLHLNFNDCDEITDKGLTSLCSDGIQYLKELKTLSLSFDGCNRITDEALKSVSLVGILNLSSIQDLQLSFFNCRRITSSSYQSFLKILEYFGYKRVDQNSKDLEYLEDLKDLECFEDSDDSLPSEYFESEYSEDE